MVVEPPPAHTAVMEAQIKSTTLAANSPIPKPIITTHRLIIRPMHPQDSHSASQHANDPKISQYMPLTFPSPYTLASAEEWINMNLKKTRQDNFVICEKSSPDCVIGGIGLKPGADVQSHTAEVGYWLGEPYWGKGLVTEALEALTKWVFMERQVDGVKTTRLWSVVWHENVGSMRCLEKCGYRPEGVFKGHAVKHGKIFDVHVFGLTKADWEIRWSNVFNNY